MKIKALIFDLDNTIYPVASIGNELFKPLFDLIQQEGSHSQEMDEIKKQVMRKPFQKVADEFDFSDPLIADSLAILQNLEYKGEIRPFDDYAETKAIDADRFLVTTGFMKMQRSKIDGMDLERDFKQVFIVDPATTDLTKKDIFLRIVQENGYELNEVLVIGDDPDSELRAAFELGIEAILYDKIGNIDAEDAFPKINHFSQLAAYLDEN